MTQNLNKKKIIIYLINLIRHDFGFYNPIWKWDSLPIEIKGNYELLEPKLKEWEGKGYVRIFNNQEGERVIEIISIPEE